MTYRIKQISDMSQESTSPARNRSLPMGLKWIAFSTTALLFSMSSCQKEIDNEVIIPDEMLPYFIRFQEAGAQRGQEVDYHSLPINGQISSSLEATIRGQCQHEEKDPSRVVINSDYWTTATDLEKEFLIFHELGHCYLQRNHLDTKSENGTCSSIMHSSANVCKNNYSLETRQGYLDELFNSN